MSQVGAADNSSGELTSQMSTIDECSEKEKSQVVFTGKSSGEPESHTRSTDKSFNEEKSQVIETGEPEAQMATTDMASEQEAQMATVDSSSGEPQSQVDTTNKSFANEKPQVNATEKYSIEPQSPASTTDKPFREEKSQETVTDKPSGEPESQIGTKDEPGEQMLEGTTDKSFGEPKSQANTTAMSGELEPQTNTAAMFSGKEKSQEDEMDKALGELKSQTSTTDKTTGGLQSQVSTKDKYFGEEKPQVYATDKASGEPQLPASTMNKSFGEENITDKASGLLESQTGTKDQPDEQMSQSTADMSSCKEKSEVDETDKASGEPKSQTNTADKYFGEEKPHLDVIAKASGEGTADKSTGSPESQEDNIGKCPSKEESPRNTTGPRHRHVAHSSVEPKSPPISGNQESWVGTPDKSSAEPVSQAGTTDKSSEVETQTGTVIEERFTTRYWLIGGLTVLAMVFVSSLHLWKGQPSVQQGTVLEIFFKEVASLKKDFPGQYEGLWFRSQKILQKHLNTSHPSEPSILILTAAQDGERTLSCVSKRLAKSYANSLHASWLMVNGPSKSKYDSGTSKIQIDNELSSGFQSDSRAAVLYRLETLPAGSLLILYKYCDHENAAFKNVALVLTVLLEEQSLETDLSFTEVEEKVKDLLWERFANSAVSAHNEMDVDKLSGVWSRISHIVLPVLPVRSVESGICPGIKD